MVLAAGSEVPRNLTIPGRELKGVYGALEFLIPQNKQVSGGRANPINAKGKHVVVIGGGDTGSDCVGTSYRHRAASVTQFEFAAAATGEGKQILDLALLAPQIADVVLSSGRRNAARVFHCDQGIHRRERRTQGAENRRP